MRRHTGWGVSIRVMFQVPGCTLVVHRDPVVADANQEIAPALTDAFDSARRLVDSHEKRRQKRGRHPRRRGRRQVAPVTWMTA